MSGIYDGEPWGNDWDDGGDYETKEAAEKQALQPIVDQIFELKGSSPEDLQMRLCNLLTRGGIQLERHYGAGEYLDGRGDATTFFRFKRGDEEIAVEAKGSSGNFRYNEAKIFNTAEEAQAAMDEAAKIYDELLQRAKEVEAAIDEKTEAMKRAVEQQAKLDDWPPLSVDAKHSEGQPSGN